jgi:hypothetical protein
MVRVMVRAMVFHRPHEGRGPVPWALPLLSQENYRRGRATCAFESCSGHTMEHVHLRTTNVTLPQGYDAHLSERTGERPPFDPRAIPGNNA